MNNYKVTLKVWWYSLTNPHSKIEAEVIMEVYSDTANRALVMASQQFPKEFSVYDGNVEEI